MISQILFWSSSLLPTLTGQTNSWNGFNCYWCDASSQIYTPSSLSWVLRAYIYSCIQQIFIEQFEYARSWRRAGNRSTPSRSARQYGVSGQSPSKPGDFRWVISVQQTIKQVSAIEPVCVYCVCTTLNTFLIDFLERKRKILICCSSYLCIHWLILLCALVEKEPTTLVYQADALTTWATQPGLLALL